MDFFCSALQADIYFMVGRIMAVSLVHGGPSPAFLSGTLFDAIAQGIDRANPTIKDIPDITLRQQLEDVSWCRHYTCTLFNPWFNPWLNRAFIERLFNKIKGHPFLIDTLTASWIVPFAWCFPWVLATFLRDFLVSVCKLSLPISPHWFLFVSTYKFIWHLMTC